MDDRARPEPDYYATLEELAKDVQAQHTRNPREYDVFRGAGVGLRWPRSPAEYYGLDLWNAFGGWDSLLGSHYVKPKDPLVPPAPSTYVPRPPPKPRAPRPKRERPPAPLPSEPIVVTEVAPLPKPVIPPPVIDVPKPPVAVVPAKLIPIRPPPVEPTAEQRKAQNEERERIAAARKKQRAIEFQIGVIHDDD